MTGALTCPIGDTHMGITAENLAEKYQVSREQQDELAVESHRRAQRAIEEGRFAGQILPIELKTRKGVTLFEQDEHVRQLHKSHAAVAIMAQVLRLKSLLALKLTTHLRTHPVLQVIC